MPGRSPFWVIAVKPERGTDKSAVPQSRPRLGSSLSASSRPITPLGRQSQVALGQFGLQPLVAARQSNKLPLLWTAGIGRGCPPSPFQGAHVTSPAPLHRGEEYDPFRRAPFPSVVGLSGRQVTGGWPSSCLRGAHVAGRRSRKQHE